MFAKLKELPEVQQNHLYTSSVENLEVFLDFEVDILKENLSILGLDITNIYYDISYSQGSGACFTGSYKYKKGWKKLLTSAGLSEEAFTELSAIGNTLQAIQKKYFYGLRSTISHTSRNCHENSMTIEVMDVRDSYDCTIGGEPEEVIEQCFIEVAQYIYTVLENSYKHQTSFETFLYLYGEETFEI